MSIHITITKADIDAIVSEQQNAICPVARALLAEGWEPSDDLAEFDDYPLFLDTLREQRDPDA